MRPWILAGVGVTAVAGLLSMVSIGQAQREVPVFARPMMTGRYTVALAKDNMVLVLDTVTGQVFKIMEADFKSLKDMDRGVAPGRPIERPRDVDPAPRGEERPRERPRDGDRPREGDRPDGDRPKEKRDGDRPKEKREEEKPKGGRPPFEKEG